MGKVKRSKKKKTNSLLFLEPNLDGKVKYKDNLFCLFFMKL